jgi:hypothetical protein
MRGAISLQERLIKMKSFSKVALPLLFLSIFSIAATIMPTARAQGMAVTLTPQEGPVGTNVIVQVTNYTTTDSTFRVTFDTGNVGTIYTGSAFRTQSTLFIVPLVSEGQHVVTVVGSSGDTGMAAFTVTQGETVSQTGTPVETPAGTSTGTNTGTYTGFPSVNGPTYSPAKPQTGFWSPLVVGVAAFLVAVVCSVTLVFVRRGRQERASLEASSSYKPASAVESAPPYGYRSSAPGTSPYGYRSSAPGTSPYGYRSSAPGTSPYGYRSSAQDTSPYYPGRYVSSTRPMVPPTISQTAARRPTQPYTKVCKHCKQVVRDDASVCPYCFKRLR